MTPGQRFDALILAALDVSTEAQADALCRAFPALWAQWAQDPARAQDPRAVVTAGVHEAWCDLLSDHPAPQGCLPADANPAAGAGYDVERLRALGPRMAGAGCDRERCRWPLGSHAPTCQALPVHDHSETGPAGCPRCDLARQFPLEAAREIEARLAAEPHTHGAAGPVGCPRCDRYRRDATGKSYLDELPSKAARRGGWDQYPARMAQAVAEGEIIDARPDLGSVPLSPPATGSCTASSWRGQSRQGKQPYGPGGYNRCILTGPHEIHQDGFGNRFILTPRFRLLNAAGTPKAGRP